MRRSRFHYWSCSKFANWIRGAKKPFALELEAWDDWHEEEKKKRPIRYWVAETLLDKLQNIVYFPADVYHSIDCWYRNRFVSHTHALVSRLPRGEWYDMDYRMIHCIFDSFCYDFCEGELGADYRANKESKAKNAQERFYEYVKWTEDSLNEEYPCPDHQIESARKFKELYDWWTIHRPARKDPEDFYKEEEKTNPIANYIQKKERYKKTEELEEQYNKEDTEKLIELIKLRGAMWT